MKHEVAPEADSAEAVVVECDLTEPPEKVWRALTTPELVAEWLMPNDIRPEVGARFSFSEGTNPTPDSPTTDDAHAWGKDLGKRAGDQRHARNIECEVLESKPPRLLSYRWREELSADESDGRALESVVTFVLTGRSDGGTHLRVVHDEFELTTLEPTAMRTITLWPRYAQRRRPTLRRRRPITAISHFAIHSRTRRAA